MEQPTAVEFAMAGPGTHFAYTSYQVIDAQDSRKYQSNNAMEKGKRRYLRFLFHLALRIGAHFDCRHSVTQNHRRSSVLEDDRAAEEPDEDLEEASSGYDGIGFNSGNITTVAAKSGHKE